MTCNVFSGTLNPTQSILVILLWTTFAFSALTLLVGRHEEYPAVKN